MLLVFGVRCVLAVALNSSIFVRGHSGSRKGLLLKCMASSSAHTRAGCEIHIHRAIDNGEHFVAAWLAWSDTQAGPLRWAWQQVLDSFGYGATRARKASIVFNENYPRWVQLVASFDLLEGVHFMKSQRSLAQRHIDETELARAEECHWFSTEALLVFICSLIHGSARKARHTAPFALLGLLEQTLTPSDIEALWVEAEPGEGEHALCEHAALGSQCLCWQTAYGEVLPESETTSPQARLRSLLVAYQKYHGCRLIRVLRDRLFKTCVRLIESRTQAWGRFNWQKDAVAKEPNAKKRKLLPQLRTYTREQTKGTKSVTDAVRELTGLSRTQAWKWMWKDLKGMHCSAAEQKPKQMSSLSIAFDASRFGRPSKDYLLCHLSSGNWHCFGPPQD
eukprot:2501687-Amphidinium_carterae.2